MSARTHQESVLSSVEQVDFLQLEKPPPADI